MKTLVITSSSMKSMAAREQSESRDSCYYPGCRKDMNCNCEICIASINATLDLIQQSSLTNFNPSKSAPETNVSGESLSPTTPLKRRCGRPIPSSSALRSTAKSRGLQEKNIGKGHWVFGFVILRVLVGLSLLLLADYGFSEAISMGFGGSKVALSPELVEKISMESWFVGDLNERLEFLQRKIGELVNGKASNCTTINSIWELNKDGLLIHSRCILYKSMTEEVSIWGWPLQTVGLLNTGYCSRFFAVLSGRVTEWPSGKIESSVRAANNSWSQEKWSASVVQLNPNTWVLEYQRSAILQNSRLFFAALELLRHRIWKLIERRMMNQESFGLFPSCHYSDLTEDSFRYPT